MELTPMPEDWSRALAVVAHPDDLEYGASGAVARWTDQGKEVVYLLEESGYSTGLDLGRVLEAAAVVERAVGHALPSGLYRAGGPSRPVPRPV